MTEIEIINSAKFGKGDYVRITKRIHGHQFFIGEIVRCCGVNHTAEALKNDPYEYAFNMYENEIGKRWTIGDNEIKSTKAKSLNYQSEILKSVMRFIFDVNKYFQIRKQRREFNLMYKTYIS